MYDDRLIIKNEYEYNGGKRVDKLKIVNYDDFIQMFINNGKSKSSELEKFAQIRLTKNNVIKVIEFLKKSVDSLK